MIRHFLPRDGFVVAFPLTIAPLVGDHEGHFEIVDARGLVVIGAVARGDSFAIMERETAETIVALLNAANAYKVQHERAKELGCGVSMMDADRIREAALNV